MFDGHVEQLADGMAGLLGGILGGARSAGTQVVGRVEAGLEVPVMLAASNYTVQQIFFLENVSWMQFMSLCHFMKSWPVSNGCQSGLLCKRPALCRVHASCAHLDWWGSRCET